ncbi:MAG: aminodeoxychorismate synthase component I [Dictyoglomaceae bacterium]
MFEENIVIDPFDLYYLFREDYSILLESNLFHREYGRYSFIFLRPKEIFICREEDNARSYLRLFSKEIEKRRKEDNLIFNGGFAGYLSYDFGVDLFNIPRKKNQSFPKAFFGYYEDFIIFDHLINKMYISPNIYKDIKEILLSRRERIYSFKGNKLYRYYVNFEREEYLEAIKKIKKYIYEGDVYQVNLSQRFIFEGEFDPYHIYYQLRKKNYGSFHAFIKIQDKYVISTSPELFLYKIKEKIVTRPIKGTIKRGKDDYEDKVYRETLINDEKCRSELLMIVDLERNDFAKICIPSSINVKRLFEVEEYSTVYHLVSTVEGNLKKNVTFEDIIKATFPGGSITGAPKLNAIKIIEELEKDPRGIYTGSIGFVANNFNMAFNIAIRTLLVERDKAYYNVGGGIVWDSIEEDEYEETLHKGKPLLNVFLENSFHRIRGAEKIGR